LVTTTEPILAEALLGLLSPLLLGLAAASLLVSTGAARHLRVGLLGHARALTEGLLLGERLSAWARTCPRIRL
jgi:hypothetical protein